MEKPTGEYVRPNSIADACTNPSVFARPAARHPHPDRLSSRFSRPGASGFSGEPSRPLFPSGDSGSSPPLRAQAAVEILTYVGFFLLIFVVLSISIISQVGQDISQREFTLSRSIAAQVADDVQLALLAGPGFDATFPLPAKIDGKPYTLNLTDGGSIYVFLDPGTIQSKQFYFPSGMRNVSQGCPPVQCPGNGYFSYTDSQGALRHAVGINASKGSIRLQMIEGANGQVTLRAG